MIHQRIKYLAACAVSIRWPTEECTGWMLLESAFCISTSFLLHVGKYLAERVLYPSDDQQSRGWMLLESALDATEKHALCSDAANQL